MKIVIDIKNCTECPYVIQKRTRGAGYAFDYFCGATKKIITYEGSKEDVYKKIMGYVEYDYDIKPIPNWCPCKMKEGIYGSNSNN